MSAIARKANPLRSGISWQLLLGEGIVAIGLGIYILAAEESARRQAEAAGDATPFARMKNASARFFLDRIVPEAAGLEASARAGAESLYAIDAETLAA